MELFRRRAGKVGLLIAFLVAGVGLIAITTLATRSERTAAADTALITETPRTDLPRALDGIVYASAQVGDFVVVGGTFTEVELADGTIQPVTGTYAYNIDTGEFITAFTPNITRASGETVEIFAVEAAGADTVLLGGRFGNVDGHAHSSLTQISVSTGEVETAFQGEVSGVVRTIEVAKGRLFVGGDFSLSLIHISEPTRPY